MRTPQQRIAPYIAKGITDPERIRNAIKKQPEGSLPISTIRAILAGSDAPAAADPEPVRKSLLPTARTFSLSSMRVAAIKPKEGLKPKLFRLKKNTGYPVEELADEWGVSADTLRRDAKRLDALLFVETSPGEWVQCVVHPDTTTERKS
jgi:hypothetical protein